MSSENRNSVEGSIATMASGALLTRVQGVDVLSWNPLRSIEGEPGGRLVNNFGDLLGPLLVERIFDTVVRGSVPSPQLAGTPVLMTVGSVLHFSPPGAVVWGTGVNFKLASKLPSHVQTLDIRSVRGPYSARAITAHGGRVPAVFGDPALLLPRFLPELRTWKRAGSGGLIIAPNLNDFESMSAAALSNGYAVLDPRAPLNSVLRAIAESGFVVGSSLHAIAIADSLGIPARFVASPAEGMLKYRDYLAGSGRPLTRIARSIDEALEVGGHTPPDLDLDAMLSQFPRDLWGGSPVQADVGEFEDHPTVISAWAGTGPDAVRSGEQFLQEVLPGVIAAARAQIEPAESPMGSSDRSDFGERFAEAYAYRVALAAGITYSDVSPSERCLLAALDSGEYERFLRAVWLEREGPHALMREVRSTGGLHVLSIALRIGSPTNEVTAIDVICRDSAGEEHVADLPVFAMYHRQWSIDLCASLDLRSEAEIESVVVRVTDIDGRVSHIPVMRVPQESSALTGYPRLSDAPLWREGGAEGSFENEEPTA